MNAATKLLLLRPRGVSLVNYLRTIAGYFASWPMQELTGTTALADNVALALGRDFVREGTFPNDPGVWTKGVGWTIPGGNVAHCDGSSTEMRQTIPVLTGKLVQWQFTVSNYVAGTIEVVIGNATPRTPRSGNGTYTESAVISGTFPQFYIFRSVAFEGDISIASGNQLGILDSSAGLGLLDGTYSGVSLAQPGAGNVPYVVAFDGIAANVTLQSAEYNSGYDPTVDFCKAIIIGKTTWDAASRYIFDDYVDADNWVRCYGTAVLDQLAFEIRAGGTTEQILWDSNGVTDLMLLDVGRESNVFIARVNGVSVGSEAIAGTFVGNFASNDIGQRQDGALFHLGSAAYCENFTEYVSDADMLRITAAFGV